LCRRSLRLWLPSRSRALLCHDNSAKIKATSEAKDEPSRRFFFVFFFTHHKLRLSPLLVVVFVVLTERQQ
jgi:hypothetical protein